MYTGLLRFIDRRLERRRDGRDDYLAVVLGHEIGHALAHHSSERLAMAGPSGHVGLGGLSFERWQESEADHIGVFLMTFAGYPPEEAVEFWERMQRAAAGRPRPPEILSDHPSDARRVAQLRGWVENARTAKKAFDEGRVAGGP